MTIESDIQKLDPGEIVTLFELDATAQGGTVTYFHAGTNELGTAVVWQGNTYVPLPIQASGFEWNSSGKLPRPRMDVANVLSLFTPLVSSYNDLIGAKVTRRRTFVKYLDAVNFTGGVNPDADPTIAHADEIYTIARKASQNKILIGFELSAASDVHGEKCPRRQVIQNVCTWIYRSGECGYAGGAVADANDVATTVLADDVCGKRLASCELRHGQYAELPFSGFPGAGLTR